MSSKLFPHIQKNWCPCKLILGRSLIFSNLASSRLWLGIKFLILPCIVTHCLLHPIWKVGNVLNKEMDGDKAIFNIYTTSLSCVVARRWDIIIEISLVNVWLAFLSLGCGSTTIISHWHPTIGSCWISDSRWQRESSLPLTLCLLVDSVHFCYWFWGITPIPTINIKIFIFLVASDSKQTSFQKP